MDLPNVSTRCALRRKSWLTGSMMSGRPRGEGLGIPSPHFGCYTASPGRYTNTWVPCRPCLSLGPSYLTVTCSLFSLVRQWILFTSVYIGFCWNRDRYAQCYCACFGRLHSCSSWTRCCATTGAGPFLDPPCCGAEAVLHGHLFLLKVQRLLLCPLLVNDRCPQFRRCSFYGR